MIYILWFFCDVTTHIFPKYDDDLINRVKNATENIPTP